MSRYPTNFNIGYGIPRMRPRSVAKREFAQCCNDERWIKSWTEITLKRKTCDDKNENFRVTRLGEAHLESMDPGVHGFARCLPKF